MMDDPQHIRLSNIDGDSFPRQECFLVTMRRPDFVAAGWKQDNIFISTDWCMAAPKSLADSLGVSATSVAILPKFIADEYEESGIVLKKESLGEMDDEELKLYCTSMRQ